MTIIHRKYTTFTVRDIRRMGSEYWGQIGAHFIVCLGLPFFKMRQRLDIKSVDTSCTFVLFRTL